MRFYGELFLVFFRIGAFTLGGGYAMLPLIEREVVEKKGWMDGEEFLDVLAIAQSLPGPIAVNTGVFVGYKTRRLAGAIVGLLGTVAPSFICMAVITSFFVGIKDSKAVAAVFTGIRPAVVALIAASVWSLGKKAKLTPWTAFLVLAVAAAVWFANVSPALVVVVLALLGAVFPGARTCRAAVPAGDLDDPAADAEDRAPEGGKEAADV